MPRSRVDYDAGVIQEFATHLYSKANWIVVKSTALGAIVGTLFGGIGGAFIPRYMQSSGAMQGDAIQVIETLAFVLGILGAVSGYSRGRDKAFHLKLEAQVALCQVQIEVNTRSEFQDPILFDRTLDVNSSSGIPSSEPVQDEIEQPMGTCPNCSSTIPLASSTCPKCKALFGGNSIWKITPI